MKKLFLVFAAIAITAGAYAQNDSLKRNMNPRVMNNIQNQKLQNNPVDKAHPDGVMMQNGKIMKVENGRETILDHDMTMSNGAKIMCDGTYIKEDGTKTMMEEGQHLDLAGNMTFVKTKRDLYQNMQNNPIDELFPDGVMMQNGIILKVVNGEMTILDQEMTMSNGTKIMCDGTYLKEDGTKMKIEEGQHLDMSGNMTFVKTNKDKNMYLVPDNTRN